MHTLKIQLLTMNAFLFGFEIAAAFEPKACHVDPLKVMQSDAIRAGFVCTCGSIFCSFVNLRQHIRTMHPKLFEYYRKVPGVVSRAMNDREVTAIEELISLRDPAKELESAIGTHEEQIIRLVGLQSVFKIVPRAYA